MSDGCETMAKCWSVTSLALVALLGYFVGTEVDAAPQIAVSGIAKQTPGQTPGQTPVLNPGAPWAVNPGLLPYQPIVNPAIPLNPLTLGRWVTPPVRTGTRTGKPLYQGAQAPGVSFYGVAYDASQTTSTQRTPTKPQLPKTPPKQNPKNPTPPPPAKQQLASDQSAKNPTVPQKQGLWILPQPPSPVESCEVERSVRVTCGAPDITASDCEAINCCHDGRHCYFGKAVTVQCTRDGQFIVVVAKDATVPSLDTDSVNLIGSGTQCMPVDSNSAFAIYQFPAIACGSMVREESGVIVYENSMTSSFTVDQGPEGTITRDSHFEVLFQCRYIGTSVEALVVDVLRLDNPPRPVAGMGPLNVAMSLGNGQCFTKGCDELSVAYSSYYTEADYPVAKVLREPVYVDVYIVDKNNPIYTLTLDRCWATTSPNPHSMPQWDILVDGCPYRDDNYMTSLVPVPSNVEFASHHRRFLFKMFTFVEQSSKSTQQQNLFIHCSTAVCLPAPNRRCEPLCMRKKRDVTDVEQVTDAPKTVVSSGRLIISAPQE